MYGTYGTQYSDYLRSIERRCVCCSRYAAINVMPHLPLYGNRVGIQRGFDGKLCPKGGAFDFGGDLISTHASRIRARVLVCIV